MGVPLLLMHLVLTVVDGIRRREARRRARCCDRRARLEPGAARARTRRWRRRPRSASSHGRRHIAFGPGLVGGALVALLAHDAADRGRDSVTQRPTDDAQSVTRHGFAPAGRRRNRIAAGVALAALAVGGNVLVYSSLERQRTRRASRRRRAGGRPDHESTCCGPSRSTSIRRSTWSPGDQLDSLVGHVRQGPPRVRLAGHARSPCRPSPLVEPGNAVVAIQVDEGSLPVGLRERVPVQLVIPAVSGSAAGSVGDRSDGDRRRRGRPSRSTTDERARYASRCRSRSPQPTAPIVAAADDVRVVLTEPIVDATADAADEASGD